MKTTLNKKDQHAFSLIELLMVLTIISIMAALIINAFSNAAQDSRDVLARQQQAALKSALDNMISQYLVGNGQVEGGRTIEQARKHYMYLDGAAPPERTMKQRLALLETYLDEDTYDHFFSRSTDSQIQSAAMLKTGQFVEFETWSPATQSNRNTYPKVKLSSVTP